MPTIFLILLFIGANAKLISSTLENYNSLGGAIDIGAILLTKEMTLIGVSNQEYRDSIYNLPEVREKLPLEVIVGVSRIGTCSLRWHLTLENLQQWNVVFSNRGELSLDGTSAEEKYHL
jgi:hypothetical protein